MTNLAYMGQVTVTVYMNITNNSGVPTAQTLDVILAPYQLAGSTNAATDLATASTALQARLNTYLTGPAVQSVINWTTGAG